MAKAKTKRRHGLDWPDNMHDWQIDLVCWAYHDIEPYKFGNIPNPHDLFFDATRALLTNEEFIVSTWTEQHVSDWTYERHIITWGAASSSKSWDYGMLSLFTFYAGPKDTIVLMATTTRPALLQRTFASVSFYHKLLQNRYPRLLPGKILKTATALVMDDADAAVISSKSGIYGVAVREGPIDEAVAFLRGRHAKTVCLIADELSQLHPAIIAPELLTNLRIGAQIFRFVGLTNIDNFDDLAGRNSVPINGWKSINMDTDSWRTQRGLIRRHDGLKSPAILEEDGERKYPHLINRKTYDEIVKDENGNEASPAIFRMVRAWPPPVDMTDTVVSELEVIKWGMKEPVVWEDLPTPIAGLDPGYGGDKCVLATGKLGISTLGTWVIAFDPLIIIPIDAMADEPVLYQIYNQVVVYLDDLGVQPNHFSVDDSGVQSVADVFRKEWGSPILRISFGEKASDLPVSAYNEKEANQYYKDRATEIVYTLRLYGQYGQIRQYPEAAARQLVRREVLPKRPRKLQPKKDFKKATGMGSPDELDATALMAAIAREVMGLAPGATKLNPEGAKPAVSPSNNSLVAAINNLDIADGRYLNLPDVSC